MDVTLFPLDTLKTRLQSSQGFLKTGGFTGLYKGIFPVIVGSAPTGNTTDTQCIWRMISPCQEFIIIRIIKCVFLISAALFFLTYEEIKTVMQPRISADYYISLHMGAAVIAEMVLF